MKTLNIEDVSFIVRRLPVAVRILLEENQREAIVAGGFIRSVIRGEEVQDIDIFAPSKDKAALWAGQLKSSLDGTLSETQNAFTIKARKTPVIQIIHRWTFDSPEACVNSFDFTIACAAIFRDGSAWNSLCHDRFYADLAAARLVYLSPSRNEDAGGSILRVLKFYQRGYRIPLDSLAATIARLVIGVRMSEVSGEGRLAQVLTGLLREVDPNTTLDRHAYLPALNEAEASSLP